jgi:hypothetical protein
VRRRDLDAVLVEGVLDRGVEPRERERALGVRDGLVRAWPLRPSRL